MRTPSSRESTKGVKLLFADFFDVDPSALDKHGAFNVSLVSDLPLFIDPFLLFNSKKPEYQRLHQEIIAYLEFLRDKAVAGEIDNGHLEAWFYFGEVKETWLGFSKKGNRGSGLGPKFAAALNNNFGRLFSTESLKITRGRHLEKLCLIGGRVGRDNISDFTTNLIKAFLLQYTEDFTNRHIAPERSADFRVTRTSFNFETESWQPANFRLPAYDGHFVLLVPKDLLTRDDTWINRTDLVKDFERLPSAISDSALRAQVDNYFRKILPKRAKEKERHEAAQETIMRFPELIDFYIRDKEARGDRARSISDERVAEAEFLFQRNFARLAELLAQAGFYEHSGGSYREALERVVFLKRVIESNDGYRLFYDSKGRPIKREEDLQVAYRLVWFGSPYDINREVNNGRGPVDFKASRGAADMTLVEFKLASNSQLKRNLEKQVEIYEQANATKQSIKVIMFFSAAEAANVKKILRELKLSEAENVILIDARRDNKPSASRA